jgi:hypothetical protein
VVLMDISMPVLDGIHATSEIVALAQPPAIVLCTAWADRDRIAEAMAAGASGHVLKDAPPDQILEALRSAHAQPRPIVAIAAGDHGDIVGEGAPDPKIVPIGRRGAHGRWQARVAGGVAAALILGSAGAAAASQGKLPGPMLSAARFVGLPTPPSQLDEAKRALDRLDAALHRGDSAAVAGAADDLKQRLRDLSVSDQRQLGASVALSTAEQRLRTPVDGCDSGDSGGAVSLPDQGEGSNPEGQTVSDPDPSCGGSTQTPASAATGRDDGRASSGGDGSSDGSGSGSSGSSSGESGDSESGSGGSAGTGDAGDQGGSQSGSGSSVNSTTTTTITTSNSGGGGSGGDSGSQGSSGGSSGGSGGGQTSGSGSSTSGGDNGT